MGGPVRGYIPTEETAIDEARDAWAKLYRERTDAGREVPIVDVPRELERTADGQEPDPSQKAAWEYAARMSVEATDDLGRRARSRSYLVPIDLRAMEAQRAYYDGVIAFHTRKRAAALKGWETRRRHAAERASA